MSMDINFNRLFSITGTTSEPEKVEDLQQEAIDALEAEAQKLPIDQAERFMVHVRQHAGDILKFLDHLEEQGRLPHEIQKKARYLFEELRTLGPRFARATEVNNFQVERELSTYQSFRNFQISQQELTPSKEYHVPSFTEIMAQAQQGIAESNVQQNIALARIMSGGIKLGGEVLMEAAKLGLCHMTPVDVQMCRAADKVLESEPVKKALKVVSEKIQSFMPDDQALSDALNQQFGIPPEVGKQYGEDALVVGLTMLPVPPVMKFAGRVFPKVALESAFVGRSGMRLGTVQEPGGHLQARILYQETSEGVFTFNINSLKVGDVQFLSNLSVESALKSIREISRSLQPKEVLVQVDHAVGGDLLAVQSTKWLEPVGTKPHVFNPGEQISTFKLATRFLKEDSGAAVNPLYWLKLKQTAEREAQLRALPLPPISSLPPDMPPTMQVLTRKAEVLTYTASGLGPEKNGSISARILHVEMPSSEGNSALYLLGGSTPRGTYHKVGRHELVVTNNLDIFERHRHVLQFLIERSRTLEHQQVLLLCKNGQVRLIPLMQVLESLPVKIVGRKDFSIGVYNKPMMLLEINVNP